MNVMSPYKEACLSFKYLSTQFFFHKSKIQFLVRLLGVHITGLAFVWFDFNF